MQFLIEELRERKMLIEDTENNDVNHPKHYALGGIETIDYLKAKMTADEFKGFLKGNVIKYLSRESEKNGVEDLKKAQWYLNCLVDLMDWKNERS